MYAAFHGSSVFPSAYENLCAELRAVLKGRISPEDEHFLKDGADGRHKHATMQRLMGLAAQSPMPEHHVALPEIVRPNVRTLGFVEASKAETLSTGPADVAQYDFFRAPCASTYDRLDGALLHQLGATWGLLRSHRAQPRTWQ